MRDKLAYNNNTAYKKMGHMSKTRDVIIKSLYLQNQLMIQMTLIHNFPLYLHRFMIVQVRDKLKRTPTMGWD